MTILFEILKAFFIVFKPWGWFKYKNENGMIERVREKYRQFLNITLPNTNFTENVLTNYACKEYCQIGFESAFQGLKELIENKSLDNTGFIESMTEVVTRYKSEALEKGFPPFFINEYDFNNFPTIELNLNNINRVVSEKGDKYTISCLYLMGCENILHAATIWIEKIDRKMERELYKWCQENYALAKNLGFPLEEAGIKPASV